MRATIPNGNNKLGHWPNRSSFSAPLQGLPRSDEYLR